MSKPARNESIYKDYYWTRTGYLPSTNGPSTVRVKWDRASLTAENPVAIKLRRSGTASWLPPLPYFRAVIKDEILFGYFVYVDKQNSGYNYQIQGYRDPGGAGNPIPPGTFDELWNNVERKALNKLKNSNVNFAQFFAEAGQTASLLGSTAKSMSKALMAVKKKDLPGALKALGWGKSNRQRQRASRRARAVAKKYEGDVRLSNALANGGKELSQKSVVAASQWLAISFGWQPLLSDLSGSAQLLADRTTSDPQRTRFNVRATSKYPVKDQTRTFVGDGTTVVLTADGFAGATIRLDFFFSNAALASVSADGLTNPAELAWELTPFSFLTDYFVGIGDWLGNLDSSLGKEFIGGSITLFERWTSRREYRINYVDANQSYFGYQGRQFSSSYMQRYVHHDFPDPTMITLAIKNPLNSKKRIGNSIAVLGVVVADFFRS